MIAANVVKARRCKHCDAHFDTDAAGITAHAAECKCEDAKCHHCQEKYEQILRQRNRRRFTPTTVALAAIALLGCHGLDPAEAPTEVDPAVPPR